MRFLMDTISPRIKHLTEEQVSLIVKRYYEGEVIQILLEEFNLDIHQSYLIKMFPDVETDETCNYCGTKLTGTIISRATNSQGLLHLDKVKCPSCAHPNMDDCYCKMCRTLRTQAKLERQQRELDNALLPFAQFNNRKIKEQELSLYELLMLCVLVRTLLSFDGLFLIPFDTDIKRIYPSNFYLLEVLNYLSRKGILKPQEEISLKNIHNGSLNLLSIMLYINIEPKDGNYSALINRLIYPERQMFKENPEFCLTMWKKIVYLEVVDYANYTMKKIKVNSFFSDRVEERVNYLSNHFSIAEIYPMVYRTGGYIAKLMINRIFNIAHCESYLFNHVEQEANKILSGEYSRNEFKRNYDLHESSLYDVFFNYILGIGMKGYNQVPSTKVFESSISE